MLPEKSKIHRSLSLRLERESAQRRISRLWQGDKQQLDYSQCTKMTSTMLRFHTATLITIALEITNTTSRMGCQQELPRERRRGVHTKDKVPECLQDIQHDGFMNVR